MNHINYDTVDKALSDKINLYSKLRRKLNNENCYSIYDKLLHRLYGQLDENFLAHIERDIVNKLRRIK